MATKLIALDAGHGMKTPGKRTPDGIHEWELNDKVRDFVVDMLKDYDCEFVFPDGNEGKTDESLTSRKKMYVNKKVDAAVSIHHNANTGTWNSATGVETYTDKNCTKADTLLAKAIQKRLAKYTGLRNRGVKKANWTVINQNTVPAVLTEGGFMDGKKDHAVITSTKGQKAYAQAVAEGLIEFLDLKKKTVKENSKKTETKKEESKKENTSTNTTKKPSLNSKVKEWQNAAIKDGFKFPKYGADGQWGSECETVAKKAICKKRATYKYKNLTKIVQKAVGVTVDGKFGSNTRLAVIRFQKKNGLVDDGCVGLATWKAILGIK